MLSKTFKSQSKTLLQLVSLVPAQDLSHEISYS